MTMRVLFLTLYPEAAASPRYRVLQYIPYLESQGIECVAWSPLTNEEWARFTGPARTHRPLRYHLVETRRRLLQILRAGSFDIVFVQKAIMTAYLRGALMLLRLIAKTIVYDIDDAVHMHPPHPLRSIGRVFEDRTQVAKLLRSASLVLAGNRWLEAEARRAGAQTELFPTVVDTQRFMPVAHSPRSFTIGWIGNPSTTPHLDPAVDALNSVQNAELRLIGADANAVRCNKATVVPWILETEVDELQRLSVGIMPLPKTPWTRGKCALKALQYMACGVPCVATPYGAIRDIIIHGENGLYADTPQEWSEAFERLHDPAEQNRLGRAGRRLVEDSYSLRQAGPRLRDVLESLM